MRSASWRSSSGGSVWRRRRRSGSTARGGSGSTAWTVDPVWGRLARKPPGLRVARPCDESDPMLGHQRGDGVLVALHGHGDEPGTAQEWGRAIAPPGWEVVAPGAPPGDDGVRSWFPTRPPGVPAEELSAVVARIGELVDRVRAEGRPVVVAGFSQGGAVSLSLPLHGVAPDAIVACCTFLPEVERGDGPGADRVAKVPVLVVGTEDDEDVPPFLGEDGAAFLDSVGVPATSVVLPGGHEVGPAVRERAAAWLAEVLHVGARVSIGLPVDRVEHGAELVSGEAV